MNEYNSPFETYEAVSPLKRADVRSRFLTRTYLNLTGAVLLFAALEALIFFVFPVQVMRLVTYNVRITALVLLGLCLAGPFIGNMILNASRTKFGQYCALAFYAFMYVAIFLPILAVAIVWTEGGLWLVGQAAALTVAIFVALSSAVFVTRKDFSFLRSTLVFASLASLVLILASILFGFALGIIFSGAMVALMCLYILYETSTLMLHASEDDDVVVAIALFSSLMTLFFYILRIFMASRD